MSCECECEGKFEYDEDYPRCHFTPMLMISDENMHGTFVYWYECKHCGHTKPGNTEFK